MADDPVTAKSLLDGLRALIKPEADPPDDGDDGDPRDVRGLRAELVRVRGLRRTDREKYTALEARVQGLVADHDAAVKKVKEDAAAEVAKLATSNLEERSLLAAGVTDPEMIGEVRAVWSGLDVATKPKTPGEYAKGLLESAKDPKKAESIPRRLQGYFRAADTKAKDPPDTEGKVKSEVDRAAAINSAKSVAELFKAMS